MFYEAVGLMISAESDPKKREAYLVRLLLFSTHSAAPLLVSAHPQCKVPFISIGRFWSIASM